MAFGDDNDKPGPTDLGLDPKSFITQQPKSWKKHYQSSDSNTEAIMEKRKSISRILASNTKNTASATSNAASGVFKQ
jgi:hypothetical protein